MKPEQDTKKAKNKKKFLNELNSAFTEIKEAERLAKESAIPYSTAFDQVKKNGGARPGAGAPKKAVVANNRSVKLTDADYEKIIKKYGSFAKGVKSLLHD